MSKDTGGPAFPQFVDGGVRPLPSDVGMTLRDYFAAQALALLGGRAWDHIRQEDVVGTWAATAYAIADAMLAERSKP